MNNKIEHFYSNILVPSYKEIQNVINIPVSSEAYQMLLSIAGQESNWTYRYQISSIPSRKGPARGFWQFEKNGGVAGVMRHKYSKTKAMNLCDYLGVPWHKKTIWQSLETNDRLAVGFARLLLWTDPKSLPRTQSSGWNYYIRNWRPGKPHPSKWPTIWKDSAEVIKGLYK